MKIESPKNKFHHQTTQQSQTRSTFLSHLLKFSLGSAATLTSTTSSPSYAFDGGVGGLGKVKPQTGVVFRDGDATTVISTVEGDTVGAELLAPDGTPALLSFRAPWPLLPSTAGIESRGLSNPESAFVQVAPVPEGGLGEDMKAFFAETIFGQSGKYGAYGAPSDIKIKKLAPGPDTTTPTIYAATFTTLTPAMRESERKALIAVKIVGDGVFMLITGTTAVRFKSQEGLIRDVAESFRCAPAPKSTLRKSQ